MVRANRFVSTAILLVAACALQAQPIRVLTTGDMHGWMEPQQVDGQMLGGTAQMLSFWKKAEGYKPAKFLVLSAGDVATGPVLSTSFKGDPVINVMNEMGYDASAVGNHEFDFTVDHLKQWQKAAKFPFLSANIVTKDGNPADMAKPYAIIDEEGLKVAVIGLTTVDLPTLTNFAGDYAVKPYAETLKRVVPLARKDGAQAVIVCAHVPQEELVGLADQVKDLGIPLMIGGHSHEFDQKMVGSTWVVNSGEWWKGYTRVDMDYNAKTGKTTVLSSKQVWLQQEKPAADKTVAAEIERWKQKDRESNIQIGYTVTGLLRPAIFRLVTESWLEFEPSADVALTNNGSMRQDINPGTINRGLIIGIMPFTNSLLKIKLTGEQLLGYLPGNQFSGLAAQNGTYVLTKTGKPVDPKATYTVVLNDFMYNTSDVLKAADPKPVTISQDWREPVYKWFANHPTDKGKPVEQLVP